MDFDKREKTLKKMVEFTGVVCAIAVAVIVLSYITIMVCMWIKTAHLRRIENAVLCYICSANMATITLLHCGHKGLCHVCVQRVLIANHRCPLCRREVNGVLFTAV